jgi:hypothetical protein
MIIEPRFPGRGARLARAGALAAALAATAVTVRADDGFRPAIAITPEGLTCVLGGNLNGELVDATIVTPLMTHKQEYALVTLKGVKDNALSIGRPREDDIDGGCEGRFDQELSIGPAQTGDYMVAVLGTRDEVQPLLPRDIEILPSDAAEPSAILRDYLREGGIADPRLAITQTIRADLDGDGDKDLLINAANTARDTTRKGEYSVVLVRKKTRTGLQTVEISADIMTEDIDEPSPLWENTVAGIVDIDGDGVMEIVLYGAHAFGDGWQVVRVRDGEVEPILFCGCGG